MGGWSISQTKKFYLMRVTFRGSAHLNWYLWPNGRINWKSWILINHIADSWWTSTKQFILAHSHFLKYSLWFVTYDWKIIPNQMMNTVSEWNMNKLDSLHTFILTQMELIQNSKILLCSTTCLRKILISVSNIWNFVNSKKGTRRDWGFWRLPGNENLVIRQNEWHHTEPTPVQ